MNGSHDVIILCFQVSAKIVSQAFLTYLFIPTKARTKSY